MVKALDRTNRLKLRWKTADLITILWKYERVRFLLPWMAQGQKSLTTLQIWKVKNIALWILMNGTILSILTHNKLSTVTECNLESGDVTVVLSGICFIYVMQHFIQPCCKVSLSLQFVLKYGNLWLLEKWSLRFPPGNGTICCYDLMDDGHSHEAVKPCLHEKSSPTQPCW